jgi:hypothetical protein
VLERRREAGSLVVLPLLAWGGGAILCAALTSLGASDVLALFVPAPWIATIFIALICSILPTLQTSTCICVNHQSPQHMNWEEGSAKAPAITVLSAVLYRPRPGWAAVTDSDRPRSRRRVFARLSLGPP